MYRPKHQIDNSRGTNHYNAFVYQNTVWSAHFHKSFELICVLQGEIMLTVNDTELVLPAKKWALILPNQIHSFQIPQASIAWVAVFSEDYVPEFSSYMRNKQGKTSDFFPDETVLELVCENMIVNSPSALMKRACLYAACDQYLKQTALETRRTENDDLICRVLDYIEAHYAEELSLGQIAQEFGYEYHYLSRLLNRGYSIRFKQVVNEYRIDRAIRYLSEGELNMTEISQLCGFRSIRSFNDVFLSVTGLSPSSYRKNCVPEIENVKKM